MLRTDPLDEASDEMATDRARFVAAATGYWDEIRRANARRATANTETADRIVDKWTTRGRLLDLLQVLLVDASSEVRYGAAAYLLIHGHADKATPVLQALVRDAMGIVAPTAKMLLLQHGHPPPMSKGDSGRGA